MITTPTLAASSVATTGKASRYCHARVMTRRCETHPNRGSGHDTTRHETRSERRGTNERGWADGGRAAGVHTCARAVLVNARVRCSRKPAVCRRRCTTSLAEQPQQAFLCDCSTKKNALAGRIERRKRKGWSCPGLVELEPPTSNARARNAERPKNVMMMICTFLWSSSRKSSSRLVRLMSGQPARTGL